MISANIFQRVIKCQIALSTHWKREWIRTFPCSGFASKEHSEHDTENNVDKKNTEDRDLKTHNENPVETKSHKKPGITNERMKNIRSDIQRHILKVMGEEPPEQPKPLKRPKPLKDDQRMTEKTNKNNARMSMTIPEMSKDVQRHIQKLQKLMNSTEKSVDKEIKEHKIEHKQKYVQRVQRRNIREAVKDSPKINENEAFTEEIKYERRIQLMQNHIQRMQTRNISEAVEDSPEINKNQAFRNKEMNEGTYEQMFSVKNTGPPSKAQRMPRVIRVDVEPQVMEEIIEMLNNFSPSNKMRSHSDTNTVSMKVWDTLTARELKSNVTYNPKSPFEEMIMWTEKGIMWKFPVNNEEGLVEEENVHFSKHIFLDQHLEEWCPKVGPIRHFMELVCLGLSKNPYLTVDEKVTYIMWYKNYFSNQIELLEKIGAWDSTATPQLEESQSTDQQQSQSM